VRRLDKIRLDYLVLPPRTILLWTTIDVKLPRLPVADNNSYPLSLLT
jgi:hypothetical protein